MPEADRQRSVVMDMQKEEGGGVSGRGKGRNDESTSTDCMMKYRAFTAASRSTADDTALWPSGHAASSSEIAGRCAS